MPTTRPTQSAVKIVRDNIGRAEVERQVKDSPHGRELAGSDSSKTTFNWEALLNHGRNQVCEKE